MASPSRPARVEKQGAPRRERCLRRSHPSAPGPVATATSAGSTTAARPPRCAARGTQHGHGGRRPGAGRKPNSGRARVTHRRRPALDWRTPAHVTVRVRQRVRCLRNRRALRTIWQCFREGAVRPNFRIVQFSIQGNHMHLIVEAANVRALSRGMQGLLIRLARALNRLERRSTGRVFADRFHARPLRDQLQARNAVRYVLNNRKHHARQQGHELPKGYIDPYSSAWYSQAFIHEPDVVFSPARQLGLEFARPPPIAHARSWLLCMGWQELGLIDVNEVPGARAEPTHTPR